MFGKNMRRLVKVVHKAILNPCEYGNTADSCMPELRYLIQCMSLGILNNIIWNASKVGQRNAKRTCTNSPAPHLGVTPSL